MSYSDDQTTALLYSVQAMQLVRGGWNYLKPEELERGLAAVILAAITEARKREKES